MGEKDLDFTYQTSTTHTLISCKHSFTSIHTSIHVTKTRYRSENNPNPNHFISAHLYFILIIHLDRSLVIYYLVYFIYWLAPGSE